jgi:hypothetical protein
MKSLAILHCRRLDKNGLPHQELIARIEALQKLMEKTTLDCIIISGGKTKGIFPSEAEVAHGILKITKRFEYTLEQESKTLSQNIRFSKKFYDFIDYTNIYVIISKPSIYRTKYLYKHFFTANYKKFIFITAPTKVKFTTYIYELSAFIVNIFNPEERFIVKLFNVLRH